jgi:hypothetical protein
MTLLLNKFSKKISTILFVTIICIEMIFSGLYLLKSEFRREDWKTVGNFINQNTSGETKIIIENNEMLAPLSYYAPLNKNILLGLKNKPVLSDQDIENLNDKLATNDNVYVLEYLFPITDPNKLLEERLKVEGFRKISTYDFKGVGFIHLYSRSLND